jgi:3D (Asp-Asp-Asp) domain-containing protein
LSARPGARRRPTAAVTAAVWATAALVVIGGRWRPAPPVIEHAPVVVFEPDSIAKPAPVPAVAVAAPAPVERRSKASRAVELPRPFARRIDRQARFLATSLTSPRRFVPKLPALKGMLARAKPGVPVTVTLTAYCLKGTTRRGLPVREGIVAADPRLFPLARHVEIYIDGEHLGRYLVDDTGGVIKGPILDIWTPSCDVARRFGRRRGTASLVAIGAD